MPQKHIIAQSHAEIARRIRLAKQRLFHDHRKGKPLAEASELFVQEVREEIHDQLARLEGAEESQDSVNNFQSDRKREAEAARMRNDVAESVAELIANDSTPPRLRDAVVGYVADAPPYPEPEPSPGNPFECPLECPHSHQSDEAPDSDADRIVGGYRLLSDRERDFICQQVAETLDGAHYAGLLILLFEHLTAIHVSGESSFSFEGEANSLSETILSNSAAAIEKARKRTRDDALQHMTEQLEGGDV